jgi:hypothetical protein
VKSVELLAAAQAETRLDDFGDCGFVEPLDAVLDSILAEGQLRVAGIEGLRMEIVRHLVNRLRLVRDVCAHPEILEEPLEDPIVIVGLPRSGTTKLQRMIAQDPAVQSLPLWKALYPAPLPEPDPRIEVAGAFVEGIAQLAPDFAAAHPMAPLEADEEMFIQLGAFDGPASWGMFYRAPTYVEWLRGRPRKPSYDYLSTMLQYLQWQDDGRRGRPWVLKTPLHLGHLDMLAETFPRAVIVHCHRDLEVGVASLCRLIEVARGARGSEQIDAREIGAYLLAFWAAEWEANIAQRDQLPTTTTVLDLQFSRIVADPIAVIGESTTTWGSAWTPPRSKPCGAGRRTTRARRAATATHLPTTGSPVTTSARLSPRTWTRSEREHDGTARRQDRTGHRCHGRHRPGDLCGARRTRRTRGRHGPQP